MNKKSVVDHLGNEFETVRDMCRYHNISHNTYYERKKLGYDLQFCLEGKQRKSSPWQVKDHRGRTFRNKQELAKYYGIHYSTYKNRLKKGYSLEEVLLGRSKNLTFQTNHCTKDELEKHGRHAVKDFQGKIFRTEKDMCKFYGVNYETYKDRKQFGWSLKECLIRKHHYYDHIGNEFESYRSMSAYWGVPFTTFEKRKAKGYSIEECLGVIPLLRATLIEHNVDADLTIIGGINDESCTVYFHCLLNGHEDIMTKDEVLKYYRKNVLKII